MEALLEQLKLIEYLTIEIEIQKYEFVKKLKEQVEEDSLDMFSDTLDLFSSSSSKYKGQIDHSSFTIKRRKKLFDNNLKRLTFARGTYQQQGPNLLIETEIIGFNKLLLPLLLLLLFVFCFLVGTMLPGNPSGFLFMLLQAALIFVIPYFMIRRNVKRMKQDLERKFYKLA